MSTNNENRILRLENLVRDLLQNVRDLLIRVGNLAQQIIAAQNFGGGGGGGANCLICVVSGGIAGAGVPGVGTPGGPLTGQTVYIITGGAFTSQSTNASIYNGLPNAVATGKQCLLNSNPDGTYTVAAVAC